MIGDDHVVDPAGEVVAEPARRRCPPRPGRARVIATRTAHLPRPGGRARAAAARAGRRRPLERGRRAARARRASAACGRVGLAEHGGVDGERRRLERRRPRERERAIASRRAPGARRGPACPRRAAPPRPRARRRPPLSASERVEGLGLAPLRGVVRERVVGRAGRPRDLLRRVELLDGAAPRASLPLELGRRADREVEHSIGYQPRSGWRSSRRTAWLPSMTRRRDARGARPCGTAARGSRGSLIGAWGASRSVMRSWNGRPSSATGTKWRTNDWTIPYRRGIAPSTSRERRRRAATRTRRRRC